MLHPDCVIDTGVKRHQQVASIKEPADKLHTHLCFGTVISVCVNNIYKNTTVALYLQQKYYSNV